MPKALEHSSPETHKPRTVNGQLSQEAIALRAYHLYLERGGAPGNELEDWIQAEIQLAMENGKSRRKTTAKSAAA